MSVQRLFIDTTENTGEPRIARTSVLADFWDAGLADMISVRRNGSLFEVQTLGALLGNLLNDDTIPQGVRDNLDRHSLERFIRDMAANNYQLSFTDELPYGRRQQPPTFGVGAIVPGVNQFALTVTFNPNQAAQINRLYVQLIMQNNGNVVERVSQIDIDDVTGVAVANITAPARVYESGFCAGIDTDGLRGFKSATFPTFTIS